MAQFFFHLHECGEIIVDPEGREVADLDRAIEYARHAARDVMAGEVLQGRLCLGCCIVVEDNRGREVGRMPFRDALAVTG